MIYIATTTINKPTKALKLFAKNKNCKLIVSLDKKSKDFELKNSIVLSTKYQEKKWPRLSKLVGWNCIQRRNFAILEAYERGAEIIALIAVASAATFMSPEPLILSFSFAAFKVRFPVTSPEPFIEILVIFSTGISI